MTRKRMKRAMVSIQKDSEKHVTTIRDDRNQAKVEIRKEGIQLSVGAVSVPSPLSTSG